jgi:hypothetical protein
VRLEAFEAERERVVANEDAVLQQAVGKLPEALLSELKALKARLEPSDDSADAIIEAEDVLRTYEWKLNDAMNLLAQVEAAERRDQDLTFVERILSLGRPGTPGRSSLATKLVVATVALVMGVFLCTAVPSCLLDSARTGGRMCSQTYGPWGGSPECAQSGKLFLPRILPWKSKEARDLQEHLDETRRSNDLIEATVVRPNAKARQAAALALLRSEPDSSAVFDEVALAGALDEVAHATTSPNPSLALQAANALVDLERIRAIVRTVDPQSPYRRDGALYGTWQCLLGEKDAGADALTELASSADIIGSTSVAGTARLARLACRGSDDAAAYASLSEEEARAVRILRLDDPTWQKGHRLAVLQDLMRSDYSILPTGAAAMLIMEKDWTREELASFLASKGPALMLSSNDVVSPWTALKPPATPWTSVEPRWLENAAARVARAANPTATEDATEQNASEAETSRRLRKVAWVLFVEAALMRARRGDSAKGRENLRRAEVLGLDDHRSAAVAYMAVGDASEADRMLDRYCDSEAFKKLKNGVQARVLMTRSLALASLRKYNQALQVARRARATSHRDQRDEWEEPTTWLVAALTLKTNSDDPITRLHAPSDVEFLSELDSMARIAHWFTAARKSEEDRVRARLRTKPMSMYAGEAVLPAVIFLAGTLAEGAGDVEVWLDRAFSRAHLDGDVRMMRARAEAARWRGDADAARVWDERADRACKLVHDHSTALLAYLAGL